MLMTQCGECGNSKEQPREKEKTTVVSMTCRKPQKKLWHSIQTYSLTSSVDKVKGLLLQASFLSFVCGLNSFSAAVITLIPPHPPPSTFVKATLVLEPSLQRHDKFIYLWNNISSLSTFSFLDFLLFVYSHISCFQIFFPFVSSALSALHSFPSLPPYSPLASHFVPTNAEFFVLHSFLLISPLTYSTLHCYLPIHFLRLSSAFLLSLWFV